MNLPAESATTAAISDAPRGWSLTDTLLSDIYTAWTGEAHPLREGLDKAAKAEKHRATVARLQEHKARQAAREAALANP